MTPRFFSVSAYFAVLFAATAATATPQEPSAEQAQFFNEKILPLLESRCFECHGDGDVEGGLRATSRESLLQGGETGPAIVPGDPDRSLLIQAVRYETLQMPPRDKLPDEEVTLLVKWVADGAVWPAASSATAPAAMTRTQFPLQERIHAHWSWKPIQRPSIPQVQRADWPRADADRFILSQLEAAGLAPAADADRRVLLRRLCFDLTGLPPAPELLQKVMADPAETPVVLEKVVDQLLASPQFGERWARHWLDLVRYAETLGHEFDFPLPHAWRYRDYVIRALNADVPWDQFVREHLAGDLLPKPRRHAEQGFNESIIATGFWYLCEDKHAPVDVKLEEALRIDNQIDVFGKAFLGLTIACARCHDHKFDAITTEDYYALSGFLQSSRRRVEWLDSGNRIQSLVHDLDQQRLQADRLTTAALQIWNPAAVSRLVAATLDPQQPQEAPVTPELVQRLRQQLQDPALPAAGALLSLPAVLQQKSQDLSDAQAVATWHAAVQQVRQQQSVPAPQTPQDVQVFADLRQGLPSGWFTWGEAFSVSSAAQAAGGAAPGGWQWQPAGLQAVTGQDVSSATVSPRLRGALHSPEWELQHSEILILAAGQNARLRLVVDGYVMNEFTELLFGGLRQSINTDGRFQWIRIAGDLGRYAGHRCHLEFLDEGDGWFAVREVRLVAPGVNPGVPLELSAAADQAVTLASDRAQMLQTWADAAVRDPAWPATAVSLGLAGDPGAGELATVLNRWRELAGVDPGGEPVLVMCDGTGEDERIFVRGNHRSLGKLASRRLLTALDAGAPLNNPAASGRLELAERVLADSNPYPARVVVNRVWQHLFGRGLVGSSDNFGVLGEKPTHPELLDLLADEFRQDGWSLKRLIRRLVLTRTYAQSSVRNPAAEERDPANLLWHRAEVRRLESEAMRDTILTISGRLDAAMHGPPVPVYLTAFMQGRGRPGQSGPLDGAGRRSVYQAVNRNFLNPFMVTFDTPQPASAVGRRSQSNVPAQALILLNSEFVHQQATVWAQRLKAQQPPDRRVETAWLQAFARLPEPAEAAAATEFLKVAAAELGAPAESATDNEAVLAQLCHALLNKKELIYLE